jgi:hypothetical protein
LQGGLVVVVGILLGVGGVAAIASDDNWECLLHVSK